MDQDVISDVFTDPGKVATVVAAGIDHVTFEVQVPGDHGLFFDDLTFEGGGCNGLEFIKKAKCKVKNGAVKKAIVLVSNTTDGQDYTCDLASGQSLTITAGAKAKFKFSGGNAPPCGPNRATVCDDDASFTCDC